MTVINIDCGANVGNITEKLLHSADVVHAFEPNPFAFEKLRNRFLYNPRVTCHQKAVLDRNTTTKLFLHENSHKDEVHWSTGSSLLDFKGNVLKEKFVEVEAIDICSFIKDLDCQINILKIDVEGVEYEILNKLINMDLHKKINRILVEVHAKKIPELKRKEADLKNKIRELNINNINLDWV
jgi:FkbM family methyltransferase